MEDDSRLSVGRWLLYLLIALAGILAALAIAAGVLQWLRATPSA